MTKFSDFIGFCNHCAAFDVPVRVPWDSSQIALCLGCFVAFCKAKDQAAAYMRGLVSEPRPDVTTRPKLTTSHQGAGRERSRRKSLARP